MVEATVAAIITRPNEGQEEVLLTRRGCQPFENEWCLPGGHIDPGETARGAVIREVKEETGLEFIPGFFRYFDEIARPDGRQAVVIVFVGHGVGVPKPTSSEVTKIDWRSIEKACATPLAFEHNEILNVYAGQRIQHQSGPRQ